MHDVLELILNGDVFLNASVDEHLRLAALFGWLFLPSLGAHGGNPVLNQLVLSEDHFNLSDCDLLGNLFVFD